MILAIDMGNTNIVIGGIDENKTSFVERITTNPSKTDIEYAVNNKDILEIYQIPLGEIEGAVLSSVVPPLSASLKEAVSRIKPVRILTVGPGIKTGLHIAIDDPAQTGADLVCVSVAALEKYPLPSIVIDMGTATTISAMDREGRLVGGSILPGVRISLEALSARTAQLPQIELSSPPKKVIGTNTIDCMKSGILYGTASMLDGMIDRYRQQLGEDLTVIATGGLAGAITALCRNPILLDENLVLEGLRILFQKNTK